MSNLKLTTKFHIPPSFKRVVARPRLLEKLNAGLQDNVKLILISAPPGYGKTTLVSEWILNLKASSEIEIPKFAWLSLDEADNDIVRFVQYIFGALQQADEFLGRQVQSQLDFPNQLDVPNLMDTLLNDLSELRSKLVFILDDFHVISNLEIYQFFEYILDHLPVNTHLVLTTRADPQLPLARLRARRQMIEVRARDLRFSSDEARDFFGLASIPLAAKTLRSIDERTEGWVAGLQLAALALENQSDPVAFVESFHGSHRYILDYLAEEVIQAQNEEIRAFLTQTSLLDHFNADLSNAVTLRDDSQDIINWLEQSNMFIIPLDDNRHWYRYHHLFAEFLISHLQHTRADDLPILHRRAAEWYQANHYPEEALKHAFSVQDDRYVSRLVIDNWRRIYHKGRLDTAVQWLETLPGDLLHQSPPLGVAYCWTLFIRGEYDRIGLYLDDIEQAFTRMVETGELPIDHPEYNIIDHQVILLRGIVMRHQGAVNATITAIEQLLPKIEELRESLGQTYVDMGLTACYSQLGYAYAAINEYDRADDYLSRVSLHARNCGNFFSLAHATIAWVKICLEQGRVEQAEKICRHELALTQNPEYSDYPAFCLIQLALADVLTVRQSWDEAESLLSQGLEMAKKCGHKYYLAQGYLIAARFHHVLGNPRQVQDDIQKAERIAESIHNRFLDEAIAQAKNALKNQAVLVQPLVEPLSERELDVLRLICLGKSNQEIADELFLALNTVKRHANNLYSKLGVNRRAQAILEARRLGLV